MARLARTEVFAPDEVAVVHVMNRTVRRCFLLGDDPLTGKNFDHRKEWMEAELERLAANFGIDLIGYAIMSNHFHLILRSRPDVVETWDDTEVAERWLRLCSRRRSSQRTGADATRRELNEILSAPEKLIQIRSRLSDISWWMRLLSQKIGRRANQEDHEVGKFWQARYRAVRLLDETAVLACAAYVDLNPIRASIATTIETSDFTSGQQRALAIRAAHTATNQRSDGQPTTAIPSTTRRVPTPAEHTEKQRWPRRLKPIAGAICPVNLQGVGSGIGPCAHAEGRRASDKGFLPLTAAMYLELLDWTARQLHSDKPGSTPAGAAPIFERLGIHSQAWCELTSNFGQLFSSVAGNPKVIDTTRSRLRGQRYNVPDRTRQLLSPLPQTG
jgi:REP element-mobilizing transposase RayT